MIKNSGDGQALSLLAYSGRQRDWLFWVTLVGAVAALTGVVLLAVTPNALLFDYILQFSLAGVLGGAAARVLTSPDLDVEPLTRFVTYFVATAFVLRFYSAVCCSDSAAALELMLLPYSGWWSLVVLMCYMFLPRRRAAVIASAYCIALIAGLLAFTLRQPQELIASFHLISLAVLLTTGHPIFILLLHGIALMVAELNQRVEDNRQYSSITTQARRSNMVWLPVTDWRRLAQQHLQQASDTQAALVIVSSTSVSQPQVVAALERMLRIGDPKTVLSDSQIGWLLADGSDDVIRRVADTLLALPFTPAAEVRVGAAYHQRGETLNAWIERAAFAAFAAADNADQSVYIE